MKLINKIKGGDFDLVFGQFKQKQHTFFRRLGSKVVSYLNEKIFHVWLYNNKEVDRITLNISGGREQGYRAWTHKVNFPTDSVGKWQVHVVTESGQLIGLTKFTVLP